MPYLNDQQPLINGLYTDSNNQTFIGRATENQNYLVGAIHIDNPIGLHYLIDPGNWAVDSSSVEYLYRNDSNNYQWIQSSLGKSVEYAVTVKKSSSYWPMYIGRIEINSTFTYVGSVLPHVGMVFYNGISKEIIANYEVLTCRSFIREYF